MHRIIVALAALAASVLTCSTFAKGDPARAVQKAEQVCAACHGKDGNGVEAFPDYPRLAGQHYDYLYKALRDYKGGRRKNVIMTAQAQGLSQQEMQDLAAYFASQKGPFKVIR